MSHILSLTLVTKPGTEHWASAFNMLSNVALDVGRDFSAVTVHSQDMKEDLELTEDLDEIEEVHDENTLGKVYDVVRNSIRVGAVNSFSSEDQAKHIVIDLQNAGILFREIRK